jgi:plastocyanin
MASPLRWLTRALALVGLIFAVAAGAAGQVRASGLADTTPVDAQVQITDTGFQPATVNVTQGVEVHLTFVFAEKAFPDDSHTISLDGYNLDTDTIDKDHPQSTLKFIANKSGTFGFSCANQCSIHDSLQNGKLVVGGAGAGAAASFTPTTLSLKPSTYATAGGPILLTALLADAKGAPVSKATVTFYEDATLGSTSGQMEIGTARTDGNGVAFLYFQPTLDDPQQTITAKFGGAGVNAESSGTIHIRQVDNPPPAYVTEPVGLAGLRAIAPSAFEVVIALVWATLLLVLGLTVGVSFRAKRR